MGTWYEKQQTYPAANTTLTLVSRRDVRTKNATSGFEPITSHSYSQNSDGLEILINAVNAQVPRVVHLGSALFLQRCCAILQSLFIIRVHFLPRAYEADKFCIANRLSLVNVSQRGDSVDEFLLVREEGKKEGRQAGSFSARNTFSGQRNSA